MGHHETSLEQDSTLMRVRRAARFDRSGTRAGGMHLRKSVVPAGPEALPIAPAASSASHATSHASPAAPIASLRGPVVRSCEEASPALSTVVPFFAKCHAFDAPQRVQAAGLYPYFRVIDSPQDPEVVIDGQTLIMLGSNNYLGLTNHPK